MRTELVGIDKLMDVYELLRPFYDEGHWFEYGTFSPENSIAYIAKFLQYADCVALYDDEDVLSGILVVEICEEFHTQPMGYFSNFYTRPEVRGMGGARLLIDAGVKLCYDKNCLNMYAANTGILNEKANKIFVNLMKKFGFVEVSTMLMRECV